LFRDAERADRVSLAQCSNLKPSDLNISDSSTSVSDISVVNDWTVTDLTDFSVGAWEPSFDTELWRNEHHLHVYVQQVAQGDGERVTQLSAQPVWVLEVK
jgi:hypothetical protein